MQLVATGRLKHAGEFTWANIGALLAAIIGMALGPSGLLLTSFTLFIDPMSGEFGWNRATASLPMTLVASALAFASPAKGYLVGRYGARAIILASTPLLGLFTAGLALVPAADWRLYVLFIGIGLSCAGNVPYGQLIGDRFQRSRGTAYGLLGFGFSLCVPLGLQLTRPLLDALGWRDTFGIYGVIQWLALPALYLLLRNSPATPQPTSPVGNLTPAAASGLTLPEALQSRAFWLVVANLIFGVLVIGAVAIHGVPLLTERGFPRPAATNIISLLWVGITASQPLLGYLMDRFDTPRVALPFAAAAFAGFVLLQFSSTSLGCGVALFVLGLGCGGESGTTQYFVSRYCGLRHFGVIYGLIQPFIYFVAAVAGIWLVGVIYDATGSYRLDLGILSASLAIAAVLLVLLPPYRFEVAPAQFSPPPPDTSTSHRTAL